MDARFSRILRKNYGSYFILLQYFIKCKMAHSFVSVSFELSVIFRYFSLYYIKVIKADCKSDGFGFDSHSV